MLLSLGKPVIEPLERLAHKFLISIFLFSVTGLVQNKTSAIKTSELL